MRVAGLDDAGRGPIIGPLVIAGILTDDSIIPELVSLRVKDSKLLSPGTRKRLDEKIKQIVERYEYVELTPDQIDLVVHKAKKFHRLNFLEAKAMAEVISRLKPDVAYVDASDVSCERFAKQILEDLSFDVKIVCEHHADRRYPVVSAASILAKVRRDDEIARLREEYGDFGSGYVTDARTIKFLKNWIEQHGSPPPIVRQSWKTLKKLQSNSKQTTL
jgi:ribonuclease HII